MWKIGQFPKIAIIAHFKKFTDIQNLKISKIKTFF